MKPKSKYDPGAIVFLLLNNDRALYRGIVAIYRRQTDQEKKSEATLVHNGKGFTGCDAAILSSFAKQLLRGWNLSPKQIAIARKKMPKYAKQLILVAEENDAIKAQRQESLQEA